MVFRVTFGIVTRSEFSLGINTTINVVIIRKCFKRRRIGNTVEM